MEKEEFPCSFGNGDRLITNLLRPLCFLLFSGTWALYLGQMLQCASFAFYMSVSVECFAGGGGWSACAAQYFNGTDRHAAVVEAVLANLVEGRTVAICSIRGS